MTVDRPFDEGWIYAQFYPKTDLFEGHLLGVDLLDEGLAVESIEQPENIVLLKTIIVLWAPLPFF